jgi:hypothetical protein
VYAEDRGSAGLRDRRIPGFGPLLVPNRPAQLVAFVAGEQVGVRGLSHVRVKVLLQRLEDDWVEMNRANSGFTLWALGHEPARNYPRLNGFDGRTLLERAFPDASTPPAGLHQDDRQGSSRS